MTIKPLKRKYPKGFIIEYRLIDLKKFLIKRQKNWNNIDHDFCVYGWLAPWGTFYYIGMGRYKDIDWEHCRAVSHNGDLLAFTITSEWRCIIYCYGATSFEAHIIEAQMIIWAADARGLSKRGQKVWDGKSMINKRFERKYEKLIKEYLNLNGDYNWEIIRREIYCY